jgi:hypothetical protein
MKNYLNVGHFPTSGKDAKRRNFEQENKELDELTKKAFTEMAEVFWSLWD